MHNYIHGILDDQGHWVIDREGICNIFIDHFKSISNDPNFASFTEIRNVLNSIEVPCLKAKHISSLQTPFTSEALKSPGVDGHPAIFNKKFWSIVGSDITKEVVRFLNSGFLLKEFNRTLIVLVPKKESAQLPQDYRSISLCTVMYKNKFKGTG